MEPRRVDTCVGGDILPAEYGASLDSGNLDCFWSVSRRALPRSAARGSTLARERPVAPSRGPHPPPSPRRSISRRGSPHGGRASRQIHRRGSRQLGGNPSPGPPAHRRHGWNAPRHPWSSADESRPNPWFRVRDGMYYTSEFLSGRLRRTVPPNFHDSRPPYWAGFSRCQKIASGTPMYKRPPHRISSTIERRAARFRPAFGQTSAPAGAARPTPLQGLLDPPRCWGCPIHLWRDRGRSVGRVPARRSDPIGRPL